jgi:hypothetical protein
LPLLELHSRDLSIPVLDGKYIYDVYPELWTYNLSHYIDFLVPEGKKVVFLRNKAMQGWVAKDAVTVASLRSHTDKGFMRLLQNDIYVQRLYLSPVELSKFSVSATLLKRDPIATCQFENALSLSHQPHGGMLLDSDGTAVVIIDKSDWDPEEKHVLVLTVEYHGKNSKDGVKLEVDFSGELKIPYVKNYFVIPSGKQCTFSIDLLQLYSYSLNTRVSNLRVGFPIPGTYKISGVSLI